MAGTPGPRFTLKKKKKTRSHLGGEDSFLVRDRQNKARQASQQPCHPWPPSRQPPAPAVTSRAIPLQTHDNHSSKATWLRQMIGKAGGYTASTAKYIKEVSSDAVFYGISLRIGEFAGHEHLESNILSNQPHAIFIFVIRQDCHYLSTLIMEPHVRWGALHRHP